jgi:hypothetical protein
MAVVVSVMVVVAVAVAVAVAVVVAAMWLCGSVAIEYSQMMDGCDAPRGDDGVALDPGDPGGWLLNMQRGQTVPSREPAGGSLLLCVSAALLGTPTPTPTRVLILLAAWLCMAGWRVQRCTTTS